jgi:hypothetical protein
VSAFNAASQPVPPPVVLDCLIDTGASVTCMDAAAIAPLGLQPTGITPIRTPSTGATPAQCAQYGVGIGIYHPDYSRIFDTVPVIAADLSAQGIQGLMGRDLLRSCLFVYDGTAELFCIGFYIRSIISMPPAEISTRQ